jgi:hypothetical protein
VLRRLGWATDVRRRWTPHGQLTGARDAVEASTEWLIGVGASKGKLVGAVVVSVDLGKSFP